jgi:putative tryptophan/tyrosine transport system substrate-binding protein
MRALPASMNLTLRAFEADSTTGIDAAFARMASNQEVEALLILADPFMNNQVQRLADLSLKNRLPAIYGFREFADAGGLLSYGASLDWLHRRAASYVDRIFKGENPGDLPIEQPTTFELLINPQGRKGAGPDYSKQTPDCCRRGDRIAMVFTALHESASDAVDGSSTGT